VVIKVEKGLPDWPDYIKVFYENHKDELTIAQWMTGYITCQQILKNEAGFTATEPLIKEVEDE